MSVIITIYMYNSINTNYYRKVPCQGPLSAKDDMYHSIDIHLFPVAKLSSGLVFHFVSGRCQALRGSRADCSYFYQRCATLNIKLSKVT